MIATRTKRGQLTGRPALAPLLLLASLTALSGCGGLSGQQSETKEGAFIESRETSEPTDNQIGEQETPAILPGKTSAAQSGSAPEVNRIETDQYSFELPGWWDGRYLMQETEDGDGNTYLLIRQKASFDTVGDGNLFTIATFHDASYVDLPSRTVWAYDKSTTYILMRPTDVCFNTEDPAIMEEYSRMEEDLEEIRQSFRVNADTARYDGEEYVFPASDSIYLKEQNLWNLSEETLRIAKNEIYARHGYLFKSEDLNRYFREKSWYQGTTPSAQFDSSVLNEYERANIKLIAEYQEEPRFPFVRN